MVPAHQPQVGKSVGPWQEKRRLTPAGIKRAMPGQARHDIGDGSAIGTSNKRTGGHPGLCWGRAMPIGFTAPWAIGEDR